MDTSGGDPFRVQVRFQDGYRCGGWREWAGFARRNVDGDRHVVAGVVIEHQDRGLVPSVAGISKRQVPKRSGGYREWAGRSRYLTGGMPVIKPQSERVENVLQLVRRRRSDEAVQLVPVCGFDLRG